MNNDFINVTAEMKIVSNEVTINFKIDIIIAHIILLVWK
jgi:hypothetical protein